MFGVPTTDPGLNLNAHAERFVRTIKECCLERMILFGEESLRTAIQNFVAH
jgi:putative transposase